MGNSSSSRTVSCVCHGHADRGESVPLPDEPVAVVVERSEYFSPRIAEMMQSRSHFSSDVEHETEFSKSHWTEVSGQSAQALSQEDQEELDQQNRRFFKKLPMAPELSHSGDTRSGCVVREWPDVQMGAKVAEGGQAEIFQVLYSDGRVRPDALLKVFKSGSVLSELRQQWPIGVRRYPGRMHKVEIPEFIRYGLMLNNGRFAFLMDKCAGDLRTLIDQAMIEKNNQSPPFPFHWKGNTLGAVWIMVEIADSMERLHARDVFHRDLKASNVLLSNYEIPTLYVADYECSIGVVGTTLWRAPEILSGLKNGERIIFTKPMDVCTVLACFALKL